MKYMAYGLPSVSFDLVETRVSGGDCVIYVPSGDIQAFADALEALIDNSNRRVALGKKARERAATMLDWRPQASAYVSVFDGLFGVSGDEVPDQLPVKSETDQEGRRYVDLDAPDEVELYFAERR